MNYCMNFAKLLINGLKLKRTGKVLILALVMLLAPEAILPSISSAAEPPSKTNQEVTGKVDVKPIERIKPDEKTTKKIRQIMKDENGYDDYKIKHMLKQLDVRVIPILEAYLADRTILQDVKIDEISMKLVKEKWNCDFWYALRYMDRCTYDTKFREKTLSMQPKHWLQFDKDAVQKIMIEENKYTPRAAAEAVYDLSENDGILQPVLDEYLATRKISKKFNIEGLTLQEVMFQWNCDFFCAVNMMSRHYMENRKAAKLAKNPIAVDKTSFHWGMLHVEEYYQKEK